MKNLIMLLVASLLLAVGSASAQKSNGATWHNTPSKTCKIRSFKAEKGYESFILETYNANDQMLRKVRYNVEEGAIDPSSGTGYRYNAKGLLVCDSTLMEYGGIFGHIKNLYYDAEDRLIQEDWYDLEGDWRKPKKKPVKELSSSIRYIYEDDDDEPEAIYRLDNGKDTAIRVTIDYLRADNGSIIQATKHRYAFSNSYFKEVLRYNANGNILDEHESSYEKKDGEWVLTEEYNKFHFFDPQERELAKLIFPASMIYENEVWIYDVKGSFYTQYYQAGALGVTQQYRTWLDKVYLSPSPEYH